MIQSSNHSQNSSENLLSDHSVATTPTVYLGTGGYSDTDMLGTLYPKGTKKTEFLNVYAKHYSAVEINSTFYTPIGQKAFAGMLRKSEGKVRFAVKLHQGFTHAIDLLHTNHNGDSVTNADLQKKADHAQAFIEALTPIIEADCLAPLLLQFPHGFNRTPKNRRYLATLTEWFNDFPLAIEFRHPSWHTAQVVHSFTERHLIWCSVDYPKVNGLPRSQLLLTQQTLQPRIGYLRMHGNNLNWWDAKSASERHDYRYSIEEMQGWAQSIANQQQHFDELYVFFQNSTNAHAYYNIKMLRDALSALKVRVL